MRKSGFLSSSSGATMIGYALLIGLIVSIAVGAIVGLGGNVTGGFNHASSSIDTATTGTNSGGGTPPSGPGTPSHANPVISTGASLPSAVAGQAYSASLEATASDGASIAGWFVPSEQIPSGLMFSGATGVLSGAPQTAGSYSFTATVSDSMGASADKTFSLQVSAGHQPPVITTASALPSGISGLFYTAALSATASDGATISSWSIPAGQAPAGLSLSAGTGTLSGTAVAGNYSFNATVTDSLGASAQQNFTLVIDPHAAPVITTDATLPSGIDGVAYSQIFEATASNGASIVSWDIPSADIPAGMSFAPATATLSGTAAAGTYNLTATATDSIGASAQKTFSLTVAPHAAPVISTNETLGHGMTGDAFSVAFQATTSDGASISSWYLPAGSVPAGLSFNAATATLSGTLQAGSYSFPVTVTDSFGGSVQKTFSLVVDSLLQVTTTDLPSGAPNSAYSATVAASGGSGGYTWQASNLPAGLVIGSSTGAISGTPTATVTAQQVALTVTDDLGRTATKSLPITISSCTHGSQTFNYTGASQTLTISAGCTQLTVSAWGGGGGGGWGDAGAGGAGGGGASVSATLDVTSVSSISIVVAGGGKGTASMSSNLGGAGGGGASSILVSGTPVLIAAGGGGGGRYFAGGAGGIGTGSNGSYGTVGLASAGHGGSLSAGGIAGTYSVSGYVAATNGALYNGGDGGGGQSRGSNSAPGGYGGGGYGNYSINAGGGGGSGYYGGGGGAGGLNNTNGGNGGGGGSSLVPSGGTGTAGSGALAGNRTGYWTAGIGDGGAGNGSNGSPGRVVVSW